MEFITNTAEETRDVAQRLLKTMTPHLWLLQGNLGAGKTTFVKGLAEALGINPRTIKSPTFTFMNEYPQLIHYDLYRLESMDQLTLEQLQENLEHNKMVVVEWPELLEPFITIPHVRIEFEALGETSRRITVHPFGPSQ